MKLIKTKNYQKFELAGISIWPKWCYILWVTDDYWPYILTKNICFFAIIEKFSTAFVFYFYAQLLFAS